MRRAAAAALAGVLLLHGCGSGERWTLPSPTAYPAALDYWPEEKAFLAGSYDDGAIYRVPQDGGPAMRLAALPPERHAKALRLRLDSARNRLWVLDTGAVHVYSLPEGRLLRRIPLPAWTPGAATCLPDLALDRSTGTAYVTDPRRPTIHVISEDSRDEQLQRTDLAVRRADGVPPAGGFTALVVSDDPFMLVAGDAASGRLWRIEPATGVAAALPVAPVKGVCGLSVVVPADRPYIYRPARGLLLYAATGFGDAVVRIALTPDLRRASVARVAPLMAVDTPVSLVAFSHYVVVPGSQLRGHPDFKGGGGPSPPFRLVLMPTGLESSWSRVW